MHARESTWRHVVGALAARVLQQAKSISRPSWNDLAYSQRVLFMQYAWAVNHLAPLLEAGHDSENAVAAQRTSARMALQCARAQGTVPAVDIFGPGCARTRASRSEFHKIWAPQCQSAVKMGGWTSS